MIHDIRFVQRVSDGYGKRRKQIPVEIASRGSSQTCLDETTALVARRGDRNSGGSVVGPDRSKLDQHSLLGRMATDRAAADFDASRYFGAA